ncbi:unnamed protein product [Lymnaea stagnalis]|uniref:G-protein coupled receptors family 1 profile domain-containing protein n=1 Tax=Lymnaea stagnalis TaxID=6523 RepID=A0AAV2I5Z1_LYMST
MGNFIIVKIFFRLGISDGMNLSLISLALCDLFYLVPAFVISVSMVLHGVEELSDFKVWFPVEPETVYMISTNVGSGFYAISMLVTTFITVVRCLAVVDPLKYRNLISLKSSAVVIASFSIVSILFAILLLVYMGVSPQFDSNTNATRLVLWISPKRALTKDVIFGIRDMFLPLASQTIVGACVVIMASCLQKAAHFRQHLSSDPKGKIINKECTPAKLVGKELQVARQMLLIATVYSLCNMPKVVFNLTQLIVPDFYRGGRYSALYLTFNIIRELIQSVNASVTFFIYWKYNSKFRSHFGLHH